MANKGKVLAIDYGTYKVGVAISDPDRFVVFPRVTLINDDRLVAKLAAIVEEEGVSEVVVGLPLQTDGSITKQTNLTKGFADELVKELSCSVILQDEKLTTFDAQEKIATSDAKQLSADKDQLAAMVILEEYLAESS